MHKLLEKWNFVKAYEVSTVKAILGIAMEQRLQTTLPFVLAVDPLCLHSESFRPQTLQRIRDTF